MQQHQHGMDIPHAIGPDHPLRGLEAGPTIIPAPPTNDILVSDSSAGRWLSIPISPEEVGIMRNLPRSARDEFQKNVHEYIGQVGKEHGTQTTGKG